MNSIDPRHERKGNASRALIFRLALGAGLIVLSVWGIVLCRGIFRGSIGPGALPSDSSFVNLAAWAAWTVFFCPLAIAGVLTVWSTLRKMGVLGYGGVVSGSETRDQHGVESLSTETAERLQRAASRAATILGLVAGTFLLGVGILGLSYLLLFSRPYSSSSVYANLATGRLEFYFALLSGIFLLSGLAILQRTFRKETGGWLLPLRVFTYLVLRQSRASERAGSAAQHPPDTKQHPSV
jgi:hypothetical protein